MRKIDNFTDEEFKNIVLESQTYSEISQKLGYSKNSTATKQIKERCEKLNISLLHLKGSNSSNKKLKLEDIFILDSKVSQSTLRKYYQKGNYTEYKCSICGLSPFWNGKELTLTLDHINGNNKDDRLENLRWVCPNCDRQLPTFCSKNMNYENREYKKEKKYCIDCGTEITWGATYCKDCFSKKQRKVERPDKEVLFQKLKNTNGNFTAIGKEYNVSDNTIRKWAKFYDLPTHSSDYKEKKDKQTQYQYRVQQIDKNTNEVIREFDSCSQAEKELGIHHVVEASDPNNSRKTAGGFYWKRIEAICLTK